MAIEFRCPQCGRLLRTPDETAGRQAQCPECHMLSTIPGGAAFAPSGSPFASGPSSPQGGEVNPYQSPSAYSSSPFEGGAQGAPGPIAPRQLDFEDVFSCTWEIFKRQWAQCVVAYLIFFGVSFGFNFVLGFVTQIVVVAARDHSLEVMIVVVRQLIGWVFGTWIGIGAAVYFLKIARGQPAEYSDLFTGGPRLVGVLVATLLFAVIYLVGIALCIVPGIIFGLMFSQFYYLIVDRNAGIIESLELSRQVMVGNKLTLFLVYIVMTIGAIVFTLFTCLLGVFVAAPFCMLMRAVIYLTVTGQPIDRTGEAYLR